ncbi:MAG: DDE-type integrase/transposase/recombinase [Legionellaceae bacterium]|nr:DDE-type integrase/transposase/recombinase [Legionellaceae bacterium]
MVMDLYSRRIIGWSVNKRMTVGLVKSSMQMVLTLSQPSQKVLFHSDRGSQYTSHSFQGLLKNNDVIASMSGKEACLDNTVVERFFGRLKKDGFLIFFI